MRNSQNECPPAVDAAELSDVGVVRIPFLSTIDNFDLYIIIVCLLQYFASILLPRSKQRDSRVKKEFPDYGDAWYMLSCLLTHLLESSLGDDLVASFQSNANSVTSLHSFPRDGIRIIEKEIRD